MFPIPTLLFASLVLTNASDVVSAMLKGRLGERFDVRGTMVSPTGDHKYSFTLFDPKSGGLSVLDKTGWKKCLSFRPGDVIRATGKIIYGRDGIVLVAGGYTLDVIGHEDPPAPVDVTIADLKSGRFDFRPIRVRGFIHEVFRDEIDPLWLYFVLGDGNERIYMVLLDFLQEHDSLRSLSDAEVAVTGISTPIHSGQRKMLGRSISFYSAANIAVLKPAPRDPFAVPEIVGDNPLEPDVLPTLRRRRLIGKVIAVRQDASILVRDDEDVPHAVRLAVPSPPAYGTRIEAAGIPETDLYRVNLSDALWRAAPGDVAADPPPVRTTVAEMLTDGNGNRKINPTLHGRPVTVVGNVIDLPQGDSRQGTVTLKCGGFTIPVDIGPNRDALNGLAVGCTVEATGTCIIETETWRPFSNFPHATGATLVLRTADDLRIVSNPPWWTPQRLMTIVAVLLLALVAILIWNRILRHVIDRKSRQLLKEQVRQIKASLRVDERTHLAVELHDTLSQNLSGVACQIAATKGTLPDGADETARYLETAERMLLSCRTELRRCLWDLRGDTLEETNFTEAIRKTLAPVAIGVETVVRFNVPRSRLSDTTAHAVLCIVRELVANAIRHGKARTVRVAGEFHDGRLSFSVRDDGRGFDPATCAGPAEGHFGLEGIRERIKHLDGSFEISSEPGKGTRAEVTLSSTT